MFVCKSWKNTHWDKDFLMKLQNYNDAFKTVSVIS